MNTGAILFEKVNASTYGIKEALRGDVTPLGTLRRYHDSWKYEIESGDEVFEANLLRVILAKLDDLNSEVRA